jgi:uncharacterized protein YkwD
MRPVVPFLTVVAAAAVLVGLWPRENHRPASPCGPVDVQPQIVGLEAAAAATLCLLNRERSERGLPSLAPDPRLARIAREHSEDMVRRGYFEHTTPEGETVQDRIRASGWPPARGASGGENIEWGRGNQATPAAMVAGWMASPGHRADILRPAFTQIGIGIAFGIPLGDGSPPSAGATYTTDFGGVTDPSLPTG